MDLEFNWETLIPRLYEDLQMSRQLPGTSNRDSAAWEEAARLLRKRTRFLLLRYPDLHQEDAEDIVQNVLVKLQSLDTMRRLRAAGSIEGYIFVILRNAVNDFARRRRREGMVLGERVYDLSIEQTASHDLPIEESLALAEALKSLTEDERSLLKMRFWRNMSIREIATDTQKSYSAIAVSLFRILRRLHDRMTK